MQSVNDSAVPKAEHSAPGSRNRSPWLEQLTPRAAMPALQGVHETDVAVVGAGIAGVATAFFLLRETAHRVVLLEANRVAHGASGFNAGSW
jgi:gamma-glutamylputrescine oxidase